jgi:hypothetical protein
MMPPRPARTAMREAADISSKLLVESVHESIARAREEIARSHNIVTQSREIIARARRSLARARRIQRELGGESGWYAADIFDRHKKPN